MAYFPSASHVPDFDGHSGGLFYVCTRSLELFVPIEMDYFKSVRTYHVFVDDVVADGSRGNISFTWRTLQILVRNGTCVQKAFSTFIDITHHMYHHNNACNIAHTFMNVPYRTHRYFITEI